MTETRGTEEGKIVVRQAGEAHPSTADRENDARIQGLKVGTTRLVQDWGESEERLGVEKAARKAKAEAELAHPTGLRPFLQRLHGLPGEIRRRIG